MSRDMVVYARREDPVPLYDVLSELERRGLPSLWRSMFGGTETADWEMGYLDLRDQPGTVDISHEPVDQRRRARAVEGRTMSERQRQIMGDARIVYHLSVPVTGSPTQSRLLEALLDILADAGDGVIIDLATDEVRDRGSLGSASDPVGED